MINSDRFVSDYEDLTSDVARATFKSFSMRLTDWLDFLVKSSESAPYIGVLSEGFDFGTWYAERKATAGGMAGSGDLKFSRDRTERLKEYLGIMRHLASEPQAFLDFASKFMWAGPKLDDNVGKITDELFAPFARDLLKFMERTNLEALPVPAADRIVTINHNAPQAQEITTRLEELERNMEGSNSLSGEADYDMNLAEVSAGRRLLQASKVRLAALQEVLVPALKWVAAKAGDVVFGAAATALLILIAAFFGITIPGLS